MTLSGVEGLMIKRATIVELVGPPGAGKTTVAGLLQQRVSNMRVQAWPDFHRPGNGPFFVRNAAELSPTLLHLLVSGNGSRLHSRDVALMAILEGWWRKLERLAANGAGTILLEEGAVCLLAKLHAFGASSLRGDSVRGWWDEMYRHWAATLDLIVVLEASAPVLLRRIRGRHLQYEIAGLSDEDALAYLNHICESERQVLSALAAVPGSPEILRFDTEICPPDQIEISRVIR